MERQRVFIADFVRTPLGCPGGSLERFISSDLAAAAIRALRERNRLDPLQIGQVVFGQSLPSTMPNNIGHYAWLKAELPVEVPGYTVQANASSGLQALRNAYNLIATENVVLVGGADSYSSAPFVMRDVRLHFYPQDRIVIDSLDEAEYCTQPEPMSRLEQYEAAHGRELSEAAKAFAAQSEERARSLSGQLDPARIPLSYTDRKKGTVTVSEDEWPGLPKEGPLAPHADGAAVLLAVSEEALGACGLTPEAELLGFAVSGCDPKEQEKAGAEAARKLLEKSGRSAEEIRWFEIKENSAEDVLETARALDVSTDRVNSFGGALAFGSCDGAEGLLMAGRLLAALEPGEYGMIVSYSAGGMGMAAQLKKC